MVRMMLHRKLLRDLWRMRGQVFAIALVIASAIATYVTMRGAYEALVATQRTYYADYKFPHVFAQVRHAPESARPALLRIPGVAEIDTRIVKEVILDVPGLADPATGRLVSVPDRGEAHLNRVHIRAGRSVGSRSSEEVVASDSFCRANGLQPGDSLFAVINGRWKRLRIVGVGTSPEFINEVPAGAIFPDHARFGVLWMSRAAMSAAFSMPNAFNDLSVRLEGGSDERAVIARVDQLLAKYGAVGAYGRSDHLSHRFIRDEIAQNRVSSLIIPAIFLLVALFLIHLVLSRLVASQRDQIATLKAFGYDRRAVALHYVLFAIVIFLLGTMLGVPTGLQLGRGMMSLYVEFFNFPTLQFQMSVSSVALALALTLTASIVAALGAVRRAFSVPPAEGMRGEPPPSFKRGVFDQLDITTIAPPLVRVLLRNLERRPARALLSIFGIALAVMILISGRFAFDSLDQIVAIYFRSSQREDVTVAFREPVAATVARELSRLPDVREVELSRVVPVRITAQQRSRRVALIGLEERGELRRLVNGNGNVVSLTPAGLLLTRKLAEVLEVEPGQHVRLELLEGRRRTLMLPVTRVVDELIGTAAYMDRRTVNRLMREGDLASMAHIATTSPEPSILGRKLKRLPGVTEVAFRKSMLRSFEETLAENLHIQVAFLIAFASIISFGIVYNSARIALSERGYELSSLRVLGFTRREAALLLLGEQALLTIAAIPLGVAFGWGIAWWISSLFDSEVYRLPLVISGYTYGFALLIIGVSAFVSGVAVRLKIGRLVLVEALKTRE